MKTLGGKKLGSELNKELWEKIENPIVFNPDGPDPAHGYEADVLVDVCKAVSRAHASGKLTKAQCGHVPEQAYQAAPKHKRANGP